jgi:hypothetical protein
MLDAGGVGEGLIDLAGADHVADLLARTREALLSGIDDEHRACAAKRPGVCGVPDGRPYAVRRQVVDRRTIIAKCDGVLARLACARLDGFAKAEAVEAAHDVAQRVNDALRAQTVSLCFDDGDYGDPRVASDANRVFPDATQIDPCLRELARSHARIIVGRACDA